MIVEFASKDIEAACNSDPTEAADLRKIIKRAGARAISPEDILNALGALTVVETPLDLSPTYNFHLLKYGFSGYGAIDIKPDGKGRRGRWRMRFKVVSESGNISDIGSINKIIVEEILEDYHKK